jgi:uncharacterized protein with NRDE domain
MCLIVFAWKAHPRYPLVLATNRDEFHERPSAPLNYWEDMPDVLGGRDIEKGGSWLAINIDGRWAAVTNFRDGRPPLLLSRSRGHLVKDYVASNQKAGNYASTINDSISDYPGCNLLFGGRGTLYYASNRYESDPRSRIEQVSPGVHSLSNHLLDTPWPKVERCKRHMQTLLEADGDTITQSLFELLSDRTLAGDPDLPSTGISLDWERVLSAPFIVAGKYGTRASTVVLVDKDGTVQMHERGFGAGGDEIGHHSYSFETIGKEAV